MVLRIEKRSYRYLALVLVYALLLHILNIVYFKNTFLYSSRGQLFIYNFNSVKYIFCIFETVIISHYTVKKVECDDLTEMIMLLLNMLYFIPGTVQQAVTDAQWPYMLLFFLFWCGMEFWLSVIKPRSESRLGRLFTTKNPNIYLGFLVILCVAIAVFMHLYMNRGISITTLMETVNDVYGTRAAAKEQSVHWILLNLEYWAAYFCVILISYYTEKKKYLSTLGLLLVEVAFFVLQGNRILMFLAFAAIGISMLKVDNKKMILGLLIIAAVMIVENAATTQGSLTNVFRRFSVVPNRLSEQYFDYFRTHEPDLLRSKYSRIFRFFGISSPYISPSIGIRIGMEYYGTMMNANNGMVGGSIFAFKFAAPIVSTFGYICAFRLFEGASYGLKNTKAIPVFALMLTSLAINAPTFLASIFSLSYFLLLYLSMIPLGKLYQSEQNALYGSRRN